MQKKAALSHRFLFLFQAGTGRVKILMEVLNKIHFLTV